MTNHRSLLPARGLDSNRREFLVSGASAASMLVTLSEATGCGGSYQVAQSADEDTTLAPEHVRMRYAVLIGAPAERV